MSQTILESAARHTRAWCQEATTRVCGALIFLCVLIAALDQWLWPGADAALRYERKAVLAGEYWRLISAHCVHADSAHLTFNILGTGLIAALFPQTYSAGQWVLILVLSALAIDAGFLLFEPALEWYVGASGILHGALIAGAIAWWRSDQRVPAVMLTAVLAGKITWEQWHGALPLVTGLPVIVNAHAYGAAGGLMGGLVMGRTGPGKRFRHTSL